MTWKNRNDQVEIENPTIAQVVEELVEGFLVEALAFERKRVEKLREEVVAVILDRISRELLQLENEKMSSEKRERVRVEVVLDVVGRFFDDFLKNLGRRLSTREKKLLLGRLRQRFVRRMRKIGQS